MALGTGGWGTLAPGERQAPPAPLGLVLGPVCAACRPIHRVIGCPCDDPHSQPLHLWSKHQNHRLIYLHTQRVFSLQPRGSNMRLGSLWRVMQEPACCHTCCHCHCNCKGLLDVMCVFCFSNGFCSSALLCFCVLNFGGALVCFDFVHGVRVLLVVGATASSFPPSNKSSTIVPFSCCFWQRST
jgi:hypothetical protein